MQLRSIDTYLSIYLYIYIKQYVGYHHTWDVTPLFLKTHFYKKKKLKKKRKQNNKDTFPNLVYLSPKAIVL